MTTLLLFTDSYYPEHINLLTVKYFAQKTFHAETARTKLEFWLPWHSIVAKRADSRVMLFGIYSRQLMGRP